MVNSDFNLDNLPHLLVTDLLTNDSVLLVMFDDFIAFSNSDISVLSEALSLDNSDSSGLAIDDSGGVPNSSDFPAVGLIVPVSAKLILLSVDCGVSPSLNDNPFLVTSDNLVSHLTSPDLFVEGSDSELLLDDLDLGSVSL